MQNKMKQLKYRYIDIRLIHQFLIETKKNKNEKNIKNNNIKT